MKNTLNCSLLSTAERIHTFQVSAEDADTRLDVYISARFPHSRTFCQQMIAEKFVTVNGQLCTRASTLLKADDSVVVREPALGRSLQKDLSSERILKYPVKILLEHEAFVVVDKPAGLLVHNTLNDLTSISLVDWLRHTYPEQMAAFPCPQRPGIVHRLDKNTSGIMLAALTVSGQDRLLHMFKGRLVRKTYLALVKGHPPQSGTIDTPIGRNPVHRFKMASFNHTQPEAQTSARQALTHYQVLEYFKDSALVQVKPITGRTHQIRVHMATIGHSLVGDMVYGKKSKLIKRHMLHAQSLEFEFDDQAYAISCPLPDDFKAVLKHVSADKSCI